MGLPALKDDRVYTYGDYKTWPEDERWELIHGVAWNMCAAPNRSHQYISNIMATSITNFLKGKPCHVYAAPFDVLLPAFKGQEEDEVDTVVQPDISVICDMSKLTDKGCTGAPDLVVEILSPYTSRKDMVIKFHLYQENGVKEYWIVDPGNRYIQVYPLDEHGRYPEEPVLVLGSQTLESKTLEGFTLNLGEVFG